MASIDYSAILSRSFEITKRYKWLWVYGLVLAIFGAGGGGGGGSSTSSSGGIPKRMPEQLPEKTAQVLGQATDAFRTWVDSVPPSKWIILVLGFVLLILFFVAAGLVLKAWAKGALITGLAEADEGREVTLLNTSPKGLAAIKSLIVYGFLVLGITLFLTLFLLVVFGGSYLFLVLVNSSLKLLWTILGVLFGGLALLLALVLLAMTDIYAERLIVLYHYSPWQAWKKGLSLSKGSFLPTLIMGIINTAVGCSVGCLGTIILMVILGIPALITILPVFKDGLHWPGWPTLLFLGAIFFIFINLNYLIKALLTVFNYSNWNLFFKEILEEKEANNGKNS